MQCTHSIQFADGGMLQMNKAEAKRYVEENITIMSMIISSSHSYIYVMVRNGQRTGHRQRSQ